MSGNNTYGGTTVFTVGQIACINISNATFTNVNFTGSLVYTNWVS